MIIIKTTPDLLRWTCSAQPPPLHLFPAGFLHLNMRQQWRRRRHSRRSGIMVSLRFSGFSARPGGSVVIYMTGGRGGAIIFFDCRAAGSNYVYMDLRLHWGFIIHPERPGFQGFPVFLTCLAAPGPWRTNQTDSWLFFFILMKSFLLTAKCITSVLLQVRIGCRDVPSRRVAPLWKLLSP